MGVYRSPAALLRAQADRFRKFEGTQIELHEEMVKAGVGDHLRLTSGRVSTAQLRMMGHPFGRGAAGGRGMVKGNLANVRSKGRTWRTGQVSARGVIAPLPINKQTGGLRRSLKVSGPSGSERKYSVGFTAPYAALVLAPAGTKKMIDRGFYQEVRKSNMARLHGQLQRARDAQARS